MYCVCLFPTRMLPLLHGQRSSTYLADDYHHLALNCNDLNSVSFHPSVYTFQVTTQLYGMHWHVVCMPITVQTYSSNKSHLKSVTLGRPVRVKQTLIYCSTQPECKGSGQWTHQNAGIKGLTEKGSTCCKRTGARQIVGPEWATGLNCLH